MKTSIFYTALGTALKKVLKYRNIVAGEVYEEEDSRLGIQVLCFKSEV